METLIRNKEGRRPIVWQRSQTPYCTVLVMSLGIVLIVAVLLQGVAGILSGVAQIDMPLRNNLALTIHSPRKSCTKLVEGVYDVTCMAFGSSMQGVLRAKHVGWEEEDATSSKNHRWRYYEVSPRNDPSDLFGGETYLKYWDDDTAVLVVESSPPSQTSNCFVHEWKYQYKVGKDGDWIKSTTPWSWNSLNNGKSIMLSSPHLTCHYQRVSDEKSCQDTIQEIVNIFQEDAAMTIEGIPPVSKLCGK